MTREGRQEVGVLHITVGAGEPNPRDPVEGGEHQSTGWFEGNMAETSSSKTVSTKLEQIAKLAREMPQAVLTTLAQHIDIDWLREAYRRTGARVRMEPPASIGKRRTSMRANWK